MLKQIFSILLFLLVINVNAQPNFENLAYDSIVTLRNSDKNIHQLDYYLDQELVMQKFYPNNGSIGGFCHGTNLVYDSILVHLGDNNYVANFSRRDKSYTVYSWEINSNTLKVNSYDKSSQLIQSYSEAKIASANGPYPLCWYDKINFGQHKELKDNKMITAIDYESGARTQRITNNIIELDEIFINLKNQALTILEASYSNDFIEKHIEFNPSQSHYHIKQRRSYPNASIQQPKHYRGKKIIYYKKEKANQLAYIDLHFNIHIEKYRFKPIILRFDPKGNLVNKQVKVWKGFTNSTLGLTKPKIKKLITPTEAKSIAEKKSKYPIDGKTSINMEWVPNNNNDSLGHVAYSVNYDFINRGWNNRYARSVKINAVNGQYIEETEIFEGEESVEMVNKIAKNGKYGFSDYDCDIIPPIYDKVPGYYSNFMIVKKDGKYGIINGKNEVIINFEYDHLEFLKSKMRRNEYWFIIGKKGSKYGLYERNVGWEMPIKYLSLSEDDQEKIIGTLENDKTAIYNLRTGNFD